MLKLGDKNISKLYYGNKAISKAYWGDKLVYQANKPTFLEYISFDGNSYIDTGIQYQTCTAEITVKYYENNKRMLNGWSDQPGCYWGMYTDGRLELGNTYLNNTNLREKTTVNISLDTSTNTLTAIVNGESISRSGTGASRSYWIGATTSVSSAKVVGEVYGSKFWDAEGEVIKDLRPCIDPKGVVCMYDMVTKKYFYNQGTGTLKPSGRFVESILFDGASYIDTGIKHQTCTVETRIRFEKTSVRQYMGFAFGNAHYWGSNASNLLSVGPRSLTTAQADATVMNDVTIEYNTDDTSAPTETLIVNGNSITVTGDAVVANTYKLGTSNKSYVVTAEVESNAIYIGGELVQDLRPYVDENNVACLKDVVTGNLFYNQGTGTLSYTE